MRSLVATVLAFLFFNVTALFGVTSFADELHNSIELVLLKKNHKPARTGDQAQFVRFDFFKDGKLDKKLGGRDFNFCEIAKKAESLNIKWGEFITDASKNSAVAGTIVMKQKKSSFQEGDVFVGGSINEYADHLHHGLHAIPHTTAPCGDHVNVNKDVSFVGLHQDSSPGSGPAPASVSEDQAPAGSED